jgi:hypothetical protein
MAYDFDSRVDDLGDVYISWMFLDDNGILQTMGTVNDIVGYNQQITSYWQLSRTGMNAFPNAAMANTNSMRYGICAWINFNGSNNQIQAIKYLVPILLPPVNLGLNQLTTNYGVLTAYSNMITWDASPSMNVINYFLFRDGVLIGSVNNNVFQFLDPSRTPDETVTYEIAACDIYGFQSASASVNYPP